MSTPCRPPNTVQIALLSDDEDTSQDVVDLERTIAIDLELPIDVQHSSVEEDSKSIDAHVNEMAEIFRKHGGLPPAFDHTLLKQRLEMMAQGTPVHEKKQRG